MTSFVTSAHDGETLRSVGRLVGSYVIGLAVCGLVFMPYVGRWALILTFGGVFIALPFLGIALIVFALFSQSITTHLAAWCIAAPLTVLIVWLTVEYGMNYSGRGFSPLAYIEFRNVIERAAMVLISASVSSGVFYVLERKRL